MHETSWWARFHGRTITCADWVWYYLIGHLCGEPELLERGHCHSPSWTRREREIVRAVGKAESTLGRHSRGRRVSWTYIISYLKCKIHTPTTTVLRDYFLYCLLLGVFWTLMHQPVWRQDIGLNWWNTTKALNAAKLGPLKSLDCCLLNAESLSNVTKHKDSRRKARAH